MSHHTYLALGSNMGDRKTRLEHAIVLLRNQISSLEVGPVLETRAVGYTEQPDFLNTVLRGETDLTPEELLHFTQAVEREVGRVARFHWGPREIDIDIVFYDDLVLTTPDLVIPHPHMHKRLFVLEPLKQLAPDLLHPIYQKTVRELARDVV